MADITATLLTSGNTNNDDNIDTASIDPTDSALVLATIVNRDTSPPPEVPTLSGNGITWVQVATHLWNDTSTDRVRTTILRGLVASPSAGVVTIDYSAAVQNSIHWHIVEFSNIDTGGSNGADAIVQSVTGEVAVTSTSLSITLASFGNSANATFGGMGTYFASPTEGSGFTELSEVSGGTVSQTQFRLDNDTTVDWTFTSSSAGGIAVEIKNAIPAGATRAAGTAGHLGIMF